VVNGVLPQRETEQVRLAEEIYRREQAALSAMPEPLAALPGDRLELKPFNLLGIEAWRLLLTNELAPDALGVEEPAPVETPALASLVDEIAAYGHGLVMLMGKGGVAKTTLAGAFAVELAQRGFSVHLTTSDPAAQLADALDGSTDNLTVSRIGPLVETGRHRRRILATKGATSDAEGRALLEEDLRSPCTRRSPSFKLSRVYPPTVRRRS